MSIWRLTSRHYSLFVQRFNWLYPAHKWGAYDNRSWRWVRRLQLSQPSQFWSTWSCHVIKSGHVSLFHALSQFSERPQLCMSLECQQEEASQHSEAGSRLPWRCRAGAASLGGFSRSASELWYSCLRCLWLWALSLPATKKHTFKLSNVQDTLKHVQMYECRFNLCIL